MRSTFRSLLAVAVLCACCGHTLATLPKLALEGADATTPNHVRASSVAAYGALPLSFEINEGQTDRSVQFVARGPGYRVFIAGNEATVSLHSAPRPSRDGATGAPVAAAFRLRFVDSNRDARAAGEEILTGTSNYFIGGDRSRHLPNVANFARVRVSELYPGIDVVYYGNQRQLEYDLIVAPGSDPSRIRLAVDGVDDLEVDASGDLVFRTPLGRTKHHRPVIYQVVDGQRVEVDGRYVMVAANEVAVEIGTYDSSATLVIDPVLSYSTYLGGNSWDYGLAIALDSQGNAYVTGVTTSNNFPLVNAYDRSVAPDDFDVFVSKLNPNGTALVYSTYIGGRNGEDFGFGIAVDGAGSAYVTGTTSGSDYPTTAGAYQTGVAGNNSFVTKLSPAGNTLVYSTYLRSAKAYGIVVNAKGEAAVAGVAYSTFATTPGAFQTASPFPQVTAPFVLKLTASGTAPVFSTFLGGSGPCASCTGLGADGAEGLAMDADDNVYVVGYTRSEDFPTINAFSPERVSTYYASDAFVSKIDPSGSALVYSTYFGGTSDDVALAVAVDRAGSAYVTGRTFSTNLPVKNAFQPTNPGTIQGQSGVAFVTKFSPAGNELVYSSYLGGGCGMPGVTYCMFDIGERANAIAVDSQGHAVVVGFAKSSRFPRVDSFEAALPEDDGFAPFVTKVGVAGSALLYSTLIGSATSSETTWRTRGSAEIRANMAFGVALDSAGNAYVTGLTDVASFPTVPGSFKRTNGGFQDAFVFKLSHGSATVAVSSSINPATANQRLTFTATVGGAGTGGTVTFIDGATVLGTVPVTGGIATFDVSFAPGIRQIVAIYRDGANEADTPVLYQVVNPPLVCD
jgi:Big-like domain-containing protein/beta-propeller repeat-containing protein